MERRATRDGRPYSVVGDSRKRSSAPCRGRTPGVPKCAGSQRDKGQQETVHRALSGRHTGRP